MDEGMSRSRDRRKKREREAWAQRKAEQYKRAKAWSYFPLTECSECNGSGRALNHAQRDAFGSDGPIGRYQMCLKCGGTGKVRVGTIHINVTI